MNWFDGTLCWAHDLSMQTIQSRKRPGPKPGSGRYGEPTVPLRVPAKLVDEIKSMIRKAPRKLTLYVVGKSSEKPR